MEWIKNLFKKKKKREIKWVAQVWMFDVADIWYLTDEEKSRLYSVDWPFGWTLISCRQLSPSEECK